MCIWYHFPNSWYVLLKFAMECFCSEKMRTTIKIDRFILKTEHKIAHSSEFVAKHFTNGAIHRVSVNFKTTEMI